MGRTVRLRFAEFLRRRRHLLSKAMGRLMPRHRGSQALRPIGPPNDLSPHLAQHAFQRSLGLRCLGADIGLKPFEKWLDHKNFQTQGPLKPASNAVTVR
jgi:hypothetical protein